MSRFRFPSVGRVWLAAAAVLTVLGWSAISPASAQSTPVVLNEVHYDQASGEQEFIELLATGNVDLTGWTISDQDEFSYVLGRPANPSFPCSGTFSLNAGDRVAIWQGAGASVCTGASRKIYLNRATFLQRDGDDVVLRNGSGNCRDYVAFESGSSVNPPPSGCSWTGPNPNNGNTAGRSISRFDVPVTDTNRGVDWERSGATTTTGPKTPGTVNMSNVVIACTNDANCSDGNPCTNGTCQNPGTPQSVCVQTNNTDPCNDNNACTSADTCSNGTCVGGANVCSAAVYLNEVHYDQASGEQEFIELYAPSGSVDLTGYTISDQDEMTYVLGRPANPTFPCVGPFVLNAGDRVALWQGAGTSVCTGASRKVYLNRGTFLQRDGDDVALKNSAGTCKDYVAFETGPSVNPPPSGCSWTGPNPNNANDLGRSISRFDVPLTDTDRGVDWERSGATTTTGPKSPGAVNVTAVIVCATNAGCDDANPCTSDVCTNPGTPQSSCSNSANNAATCSDGSACTRQDVCQSGTCVGQDPVVCPAPDACHFPGTCDGATGTCSNPRQPDGMPCQIANACSLGADRCEYGVCVPGGNPACTTPIGGPAFSAAVPAGPKGWSISDASSSTIAERPEPLTPDERRQKAFAKTVARRLAAKPSAHRESTLGQPPPDGNAVFDTFVGYWLLETIDDWSHATAMEFYRTPGGEFRVKFYNGTQNALREINLNDRSFFTNSIAPLGNDVAVSVLGPKALRIHNTSDPGNALSSDELSSTVRIQDFDANVLYGQFWTDWDGTGDDARYGAVENLSRYRRLSQAPQIQRNDQPSAIDWSDPLELFQYLHDYYALLGQPEKLESINEVNWVGAAGYEALYNQFKTTGVVRSATTSTANRGGGYIGVWPTKFPAIFPFTTIHTAAPHRFTPGSAVTISGFTGLYAVLNGVHFVPGTPPSTWTGGMPEPWQADSTRQPFVLVDVDTSGIVVPYDPDIHGVGQLQATHGPIASGTEYRELVAALCDFVVSAFGPGTHTRPLFWIRGDRMIPATFAELSQGLADGTISSTVSFRTRDYASRGNADIYWNPTIVGGSPATPEFNINDPFGLGRMQFNPLFNYDIDLENYLAPASARNVFFTVTGPEIGGEPITSLLTAFGYPSNGSQVVFRTGAFATPPADLVDALGTHPFVPYGSANNDPGGNVYRYHFNLLGGLVRSELACGRKVAYIRIGDEDAFDAPLYQLSLRSLAFGRGDMQSKVKSNWTAAMAALLADLEAQAPDRYIIDLRRNDGGFSYVGDAFAALFGGDRPGQEAVVSLVHSGLDPGVTPVDGSGILTGNDSLVANLASSSQVQTNEAAVVFPGAVVRGNAGRRVDVILLTSTHAASGGDLFPHSFLGPDPGSRIHDLGHNVFARIIGDIDGRLWSGLKTGDGSGIDPLNPDLVNQFGTPRTPFYLASDAGLLFEDRHGTLVNPQTCTQPAALLRGWYDQAGWQDLGFTPPAVSYPLGTCTKELPQQGVPSTWRDVWLEHAIVD